MNTFNGVYGGQAYANGSIGLQGSRADYWPSSLSDANNAYRLLFSSTQVIPASYTYKYNGHSLRCVMNFNEMCTFNGVYGGFCESTGSFGLQGTDAYYFSSSYSDANFAYILALTNKVAYPAQGTSGEKYEGLTLRCVRNLMRWYFQRCVWRPRSW